MESTATTIPQTASNVSIGSLRTDILIALAAGLGLFLLASTTPDIPSGFDAYRHVKLASRLPYEAAEVMKDPWRLAYLWAKPVDPYVGFHVLLAPFTMFLELITAIKLLGSIIFAGTVLVVLRLLLHFNVEHRVVWAIVAVAGSGITLHRATVSRPFVLAILMVLLVALFTVKNKPIAVGIASAVHAITYSMFFLAAMAPGIWFLLRRDRSAFRILLACMCGMAAGVLINPYFPENLYYVLVNAGAVEIAAKAGVVIGGELGPMQPVGFFLASLPVVLAWVAAIVMRIRNRRDTRWGCDRDLFLALSLVSLAGSFRVGRTFDFFVPFAALYAAVELTPWIKQNRQQFTYAGGVGLGLCVLNVFLTYQTGLTTTPVERYRNVSSYLREHAPDELVINAYSSSYYYLYFWNTASRYFIGIEPTFTYMHAPEKYWLWRHLSDDEQSTCDQRVCPEASRMDAVSAVANGLDSQYLLTEHAMHPKLEATLNVSPRVNTVFRDSYLTLYKLER